MEYEQLDFFELLPGVAGGRALRRLKGDDYFAKLGEKGGAATRDRHGEAHLRKIAQEGAQKARKKKYSTPRTVKQWHGGIERIVPYWPPKSTKRRKRPIYVRIELE
jgi:hypothetical protein